MNIKRILVGSAASAVMLGSMVGFAAANVDRVPGPVEYEPWNLTGSYDIDFTCTTGCGGVYPHTMDVSSSDLNTGDFEATGYNAPLTVTWVADNGNVAGSDISFTINYDSSSYFVDVTGVIAEDGSMSGTAGNASQTFDWKTTAGTVDREEITFTGNHGEWVSSSDDKKEAAQERVGMPTKSKGHTK